MSTLWNGAWGHVSCKMKYIRGWGDLSVHVYWRGKNRSCKYHPQNWSVKQIATGRHLPILFHLSAPFILWDLIASPLLDSHPNYFFHSEVIKMPQPFRRHRSYIPRDSPFISLNILPYVRCECTDSRAMLSHGDPCHSTLVLAILTCYQDI